jgi:hypothetical protein
MLSHRPADPPSFIRYLIGIGYLIRTIFRTSDQCWDFS